MNDYERESVLMIIEVAHSPSLTFDLFSGTVIGQSTILNARGKMDKLATYASVEVVTCS